MSRQQGIEEGVEVVPAPVSQLQDLVGGLDEPWIADEGPMDCGLRRGLAGLPLRQRGMAFDRQQRGAIQSGTYQRGQLGRSPEDP